MVKSLSEKNKLIQKDSVKINSIFWEHVIGYLRGRVSTNRWEVWRETKSGSVSSGIEPSLNTWLVLVRFVIVLLDSHRVLITLKQVVSLNYLTYFNFNLIGNIFGLGKMTPDFVSTSLWTHIWQRLGFIISFFRVIV